MRMASVQGDPWTGDAVGDVDGGVVGLDVG